MCEDGGFGGADEGLIGEDEVEIIIELYEEAIQDDSEYGHAGVVAVVVYVVEGAELILLEEIEIGEEGVGGQVYLGALEDYEGFVLVQAA